MKKSDKRALARPPQRDTCASALGINRARAPIGADTLNSCPRIDQKSRMLPTGAKLETPWKLGDAVEAKYLAQKCVTAMISNAHAITTHHRTPSRRNKFAPNLKWYRGRIASAPDADGACDVEYDDGDFEEHGTCRPMHPCPACKPLITSLRLSQYRQNTFVCRVRRLPSSRHCRRLFRRPIQ